MKKDYNWCYYLVASVDILGQTEAFKGIDHLPSDQESQKKLREVHKETVLFIEALREGFKNYFESYLKDSESKIKVPKGKKKKFDAIRKSTSIKYQFFSDSMIASVPLETKDYHSNAVIGVHGVLGGCGGIFLFLLSEKKAFRVGIDVGIGTELKNGDVYGPALIKAYKLESKTAKYPRIVIGSELINYLKNLSNKEEQLPSQDKEDIEACKIMADFCMNMIVIDIDGLPILDYLGDKFLSSFKKINDSQKILKKAYEFVKGEYKKQIDLGNNKLALRYYLLNNYFKVKFPRM
ncbi:MAG: hypothetical protein ACTSRA_22735 [Promethearchaeota archaeon]